MSETKKFLHSKMISLGAIVAIPETEYHCREIELADGNFGSVYGDANAGPEDPYLVILDYLMEAGEVVSYVSRPKKSGNGNLIWINLDKSAIPAQLKKYKEAKEAAASGKETGYVAPPAPVVASAASIPPPAAKPAGTPAPPPPGQERTPEFPAAPRKLDMPPPAKAAVIEDPRPKEEVPPPAPPPEKAKGSVHPHENDTFFGYGNRNVMLDAKDAYFRALEKHKLARDQYQDQEFAFRYFLTTSVDILKESSKKLPPAQVMDLAWDMAVQAFNKWRTTQFNPDGTIAERLEKAGEPA